MPEKRMRIVVVEDEPLARRAAVHTLSAIEWIDVIGEAADGPAAAAMLDALQPDVALMDINLPGYGAFDVLDRLAEPPAVIFVTAHGHHAAAAFDLAAIDYVLKPYEPARLLLALERARDALRGHVMAGVSARASIERARHAMSSAAAVDTLFVRDRGAVVAVPVADVVRFEADDAYVAILTATRRHLVQLPLADVERRLPAGKFLRVHRCHIVNLAHVAAFAPHDGGRFVAELRDGSRVPVSRRHARAVRELVRGLAMECGSRRSS
jgi:two-component system LytT family response regulator